ncbi:hypothetical protein CO051_03125 [Candidatus Roizmanbacteria bacterium CG_4_9_14_0_2_um_filter_39_13]|uniref:Uncharacterized protein n=2 Tax=Candidatus Roizmaniibacteriota TaxID=1752723 RepID=A0A2M8EZQ1_9BACT|nr:MAG: hypothetical protein COY15_03965 [Candidatus Roizmanbacteria bacterium CG_4_10_14_0_2_um_filter_39_12]PJC32497.1 MAG: hypothetical protein CO051_03125 [Candidatus Roizmanbacteria bacterium CG_4_9_14_0_2_um_filter_39_13]PJE62190.1 MAG: hypothetical protein COU87_00630 [Candidatus Roizmanbacteria bacterium CG10_big_fil_rev_8_21_14_0_10_39_12]
MNKNILVKLTSIAAAASLLVGVAFAAFTSNQTTITGVVLSSATPALQVYDSGGNWNPTADGNGLGIKEQNMYPGLTGAEHAFYLRNSSDTSVPFGQIVGTVTSADTDWSAYQDNVQMRFGEVTTDTWTGWNNLSWWNATGANFLASQLAGGNTQRQFRVQFYMNPGAPNTLQGSNLDMTLNFVGMTP